MLEFLSGRAAPQTGDPPAEPDALLFVERYGVYTNSIAQNGKRRKSDFIRKFGEGGLWQLHKPVLREKKCARNKSGRTDRQGELPLGELGSAAGRFESVFQSSER